MTKPRSSTCRFRPLSDLPALAAAAFLTLAAPPVGAQQAAPLAAPSPILVVDQDRLFADSAFGRRAVAEIEARATELAAENRRIEADLVAEEQALTERRQAMDAAAFRTLAEDFDDRVQALRAEQDAKVRDVQRLRDTARQDFSARIGPILSDLVLERGAVILMDSRAVLRAVENVDITDAAIARIDSVLGEGAPPPDAPGAPDAD
ncbi:hypothetical protein OCGS_2344 [Oceaniovalibus guishaninsula JLT2003]|uniref:Outer membrane chaperone Skp n=1 Tax=Oceaniovalibus guishaninsula JLT2003 TaxID=1231392 RepID=K2HAF3_9RHOB|nr:OmpH family outer membrane protein [Oceaniovalibus guishaninsula]EKE43612.1 hypothetical protein OCGS_2344 [Oceaniovalibus guishaninsula JLT2003]